VPIVLHQQTDKIADQSIVIRYEDDGMVCFGWPEIREDDRFFRLPIIVYVRSLGSHLAPSHSPRIAKVYTNSSALAMIFFARFFFARYPFQMNLSGNFTVPLYVILSARCPNCFLRNCDSGKEKVERPIAV